MNKILKKSLGVLLSLMMVIGLVSCGSNNEKDNANSGEPKTLKVYTWWDITKFAHIKTAAVERPIPIPFIAEVVTASVGHIPIT